MWNFEKIQNTKIVQDIHWLVLGLNIEKHEEIFRSWQINNEDI